MTPSPDPTAPQPAARHDSAGPQPAEPTASSSAPQPAARHDSAGPQPVAPHSTEPAPVRAERETPEARALAEQLRRCGEGLASCVKEAKHIEIFTGAGMSADSGLDTFRDATTGIWSNVDPQDMASLSAWARDPDPMMAWYLWRGTLCRRAEPNAGHIAIAQWQARVAARGETERGGTKHGGTKHGGTLHISTQNIDDLHERGGATNISHLHGSLFAYRCSICSKPAKTPRLPSEPLDRTTPPACTLCGNPVRPGVVWFGESLPQKEWDAAELSMSTADLVVIVGTSGVVYPAAGLPQLASQMGTPIIEISPAPTELTSLATWSLRTTAAVGLPTLLSLLDA